MTWSVLARKRGRGWRPLRLEKSDFLSKISPFTLQFMARNWYRIEKEEKIKNLGPILGHGVAGLVRNSLA